MAAAVAVVTIPVDLFVAVCEALEAASGELTMLDEGDVHWEVPDDLQRLLDERLRLIATLAAAKAADPALGRRLAATYRETSAHADYVMPRVPVMPGIREELDACQETIRRRSLSEPAVAEAIRAVLPKGWAW